MKGTADWKGVFLPVCRGVLGSGQVRRQDLCTRSIQGPYSSTLAEPTIFFTRGK